MALTYTIDILNATPSLTVADQTGKDCEWIRHPDFSLTISDSQCLCQSDVSTMPIARWYHLYELVCSTPAPSYRRHMPLVLFDFCIRPSTPHSLHNSRVIRQSRIYFPREERNWRHIGRLLTLAPKPFELRLARRPLYKHYPHPRHEYALTIN